MTSPPSTEGSARASVFLIAQPTIGGAALQVRQLAAGLSRADFDVTVVSPGGGWLRRQVLDSGLRHVALEMPREIRPVGDLRAFIDLYSLLRRERPQLVHCHSSKAGFLGRLAARLAGVHIVLYTPHGFSFEQSTGAVAWFYLALERGSARLADRIICVSATERSAALRTHVAPPAKLVVIQNGVDLPSASREGIGRLRRILGVGEGCRIVAMVSRLRRPKRPEDLLAAASLLSLDDSSDRLRIVFVGGGPLERGLRDQTHRMGLGTRVTLLGDRLDVPELMPDIDVVVLASSAEGMPYSILEAMAAGKPVVGSRVPGIADLIREGETGYGYTLGEPQELAGVLRALLGDADLRRRLGAAGRRTVAKSYSVKRMVRETENLYRMLVMGRAPALSNHP